MVARIVDNPEAELTRDDWCAVVAERHGGWTIEPDADARTNPINSYKLDRVSMVSCRVDRCSGWRAGDIAGAQIGVVVIHEGHEDVSIDGDTLTLSAGDLAVWDTRSMASFEVFDYVDKSSIFVDRSLVESWYPRLPDRPGVWWTSAENTLGLRSLTRAIDLTRPDVLLRQNGASLANALCELVFVTLGSVWHKSNSASLGRNETLWMQLIEYIEINLTFRITAESLAQRFSLSARSVYQLFADHGTTVQRYIKSRRLERARDELMRSGDGVKIATIAQHWGFADQTSFTKAFRQQFSVSPGRFRAEMLSSAS